MWKTEKLNINIRKKIDDTIINDLLSFTSKCIEENGETYIEKSSPDDITILCAYPDISDTLELGNLEYKIRDFIFTGEPEKDAKIVIELLNTINKFQEEGYDISLSKSGNEYGGISIVASKKKEETTEE